ncbi:MAG: dihydrofolate reductase [Candidatus Peregrinibacteria bacterium Greene0416_19]|nr:MAG: dihydrofolate reductase [Candidatus Peregrinibacteria bacterium Greene0416_19]
MLLSLIVAADEDNVIGSSNKLLWRLPDDQKRMKALTMGKPLIMGRKTHESIGRPLPGRQNIVITRQRDRDFPGCEIASSLEQALALAREGGADESIIFGGGEVYREAMPLADRIYLTRVHATFDGDATFPDIDPAQWKEIRREEHLADARHAHAFTFIDYHRIC